MLPDTEKCQMCQIQGFSHVALELIEDYWNVSAPIIWDVTLFKKNTKEVLFLHKKNVCTALSCQAFGPREIKALTHVEIQRGISTHLQVSIVGVFQI